MMFFIADDSDAVRGRLIELLSEVEGAEVIGQAATTADAIEGIRRLKPHVVILDIRMPGGGGLDVLKHIKQESRPPVVMMLTNHASPQYRKKCVEWGADFFLDKSRDLECLLTIFRSLARRFIESGAGTGAAT
jgi:DNA-binding NarL/FixJ family response regulator